MSDYWIRVIPTDPNFVPSPSSATAAVRLLARFAPAHLPDEASHAADEGEIIFVDAGSNFESLRCSACQSPLDTAWWQDRMGAAFAASFTTLMIRTPCCDASMSLNDLTYDGPQGFARWRLEVMNPTVGALSGSQIAQIEAALGHRVRVVYRHL